MCFAWQPPTFWIWLIASSWCHWTHSAVPSSSCEMMMESETWGDRGSIFSFQCAMSFHCLALGDWGHMHLLASLFLSPGWSSGCCQPAPATMMLNISLSSLFCQPLMSMARTRCSFRSHTVAISTSVIPSVLLRWDASTETFHSPVVGHSHRKAQDKCLDLPFYITIFSKISRDPSNLPWWHWSPFLPQPMDLYV